MTAVQEQVVTDRYALYLGDSCEVIKGIPDNSLGFQLFSPPFSNLYIYSDSWRDMGNTTDEGQFFQHFDYMIPELYRTLAPGRICAVHCKDLVRYKGRDGKAGLYDFPGEIVRHFEAAGFQYHSRVTIWKDPVIEMQRTKAHGLLYKQLRKDSTFSRQGMAEYMLIFRKWAEDGEEVAPVEHTPEEFPLDQWQEWASPVWMTVNQTRVLNAAIARSDEDEKHICPFQLDVCERSIAMWSNPGDVVFDPFNGIGSTGYTALQLGRKYIGIELKKEYFDQAKGFLAEIANDSHLSLFGEE
jgi:DNA modification methylase